MKYILQSLPITAVSWKKPLKNYLRMILPTDFSCVFLAEEWKKENLYGEFLSLLASRQLIEVTGMIMAVLFVTLRFNKNMATKEVLYQIPDC